MKPGILLHHFLEAAEKLPTLTKTMTTSDVMTIYVTNRDKDINFEFLVKRTTTFQRMLQAMCERKNLDPGAIRFVYNGIELQRHCRIGDYDLVHFATIFCDVNDG